MNLKHTVLKHLIFSLQRTWHRIFCSRVSICWIICWTRSIHKIQKRNIILNLQCNTNSQLMPQLQLFDCHLACEFPLHAKSRIVESLTQYCLLIYFFSGFWFPTRCGCSAGVGNSWRRGRRHIFPGSHVSFIPRRPWTALHSSSHDVRFMRRQRSRFTLHWPN